MSGDESLLETLLQNLLDNANKYTPKGGEVVVTVGSEKGKAFVLVEDSGPGIGIADREYVFDRFYRVGNDTNSTANGSGSGSGSGLGLSIVAHIVQLHNARIGLSSSRYASGLAVKVEFEPGEAA